MSDVIKKACITLEKPKNELEREICEYIKSVIDDKLAERINEKKLTPSGCLEYCFKQGHKLEVKNGNMGIAKVSEEQHWEWVRKYYGIKAAADKPKQQPSSSAGKSDDDLFDELFG